MEAKPNRHLTLTLVGVALLGWAATWSCSSPDQPGSPAGSGQTGSSSSSSTAAGGGGSSTSGSSTAGPGTTTGDSTSTGAGGTGSGGTGPGDASAGSGGAGGSPPPPDGGPVDDPSPRIKFNFNVGWKFIKQDVTGAQAPAFDDAAWANVSTPHTFNDVDTYSHLTKSEADGEKGMWTGKTWYRKHFTVPADLADRKVFIEFEGVRQRGRVYINGVDVGMNESGFVPFGFDLTANIKFGQDNVLAVLCDNTFPMNAEGSSDPLLWHDSHWHPNFGGIYRNVYLHVTDKTHVTLPLYSNLKTSGVYARATNVTNAAAQVAVDAEVMNEDAAAKAVDFSAKVMDAQGTEVLTITDQQMVPAGKSLVFAKTATLMNPKLWEPANPHVYRVQVTLKSAGTTLDVTSVPLGIRYWKFDLTNGFTINGKHVKLHGWGQKPTQSWAGLGAATPEWMHEYTMRMQKAANSNFMRWAHCAGSPGNIQFSDKYGIVVLQPGVDAEGDNAGAAWTARANAFRSMVTYFRNNPSILIWEGGNQATKTSVAHIMEIKQIAAQLDPTRTFAFRRENPMIAQYFDISIGTEAGNDAPSLPVVEGEYGRWESPRRVWDALSPPSFGYNIAADRHDARLREGLRTVRPGPVQRLGGLKAPGRLGGRELPFHRRADAPARLHRGRAQHRRDGREPAAERGLLRRQGDVVRAAAGPRHRALELPGEHHEGHQRRFERRQRRALRQRRRPWARTRRRRTRTSSRSRA